MVRCAEGGGKTAFIDQRADAAGNKDSQACFYLTNIFQCNQHTPVPCLRESSFSATFSPPLCSTPPTAARHLDFIQFAQFPALNENRFALSLRVPRVDLRPRHAGVQNSVFRCRNSRA